VKPKRFFLIAASIFFLTLAATLSLPLVGVSLNQQSLTENNTSPNQAVGQQKLLLSNKCLNKA
jgi:hypothetical protein